MLVVFTHEQDFQGFYFKSRFFVINSVATREDQYDEPVALQEVILFGRKIAKDIKYLIQPLLFVCVVFGSQCRLVAHDTTYNGA